MAAIMLSAFLKPPYSGVLTRFRYLRTPRLRSRLQSKMRIVVRRRRVSRARDEGVVSTDWLPHGDAWWRQPDNCHYFNDTGRYSACHRLWPSNYQWSSYDRPHCSWQPKRLILLIHFYYVLLLLVVFLSSFLFYWSYFGQHFVYLID